MKKKTMKKGITLIEIILAIVLIAIILGITIPKLMSNSQRAELKSVITSDVKSIVEAAMIWKKSSAAAQGSFVGLDAPDLNSRIPSNMTVNVIKGDIYSSGLQTGKESADGDRESGVQYYITWKIADANPQTAAFTIAMDLSRGRADLNWDAKTQQYARDVFMDVINELSTETSPSPWTSGTINGGINGATKAADFVMPTTGTSVTCTNAGDVVCYDNIRFD